MSSIDISLWVVRVTGTCDHHELGTQNFPTKKNQKAAVSKSSQPSPKIVNEIHGGTSCGNNFHTFSFPSYIDSHPLFQNPTHPIVYCAPWRFFHMHLLRLSKPPWNPRIPPVPDVSTHGLFHSRHRWWAGYCEDIGLQICFRRAQQNRHLGAVTTWKWVGGSERGRFYIISDTLR